MISGAIPQNPLLQPVLIAAQSHDGYLTFDDYITASCNCLTTEGRNLYH